jgi:ribosomal protein L7/L12
VDSSDPEQLVRQQLEQGRSADQIAKLLIDSGVRPIPAIKALRAIGGLTLPEAKELVDGALPPDVLAATERLRDELEEAVRQLAEEQADPSDTVAQ